MNQKQEPLFKSLKKDTSFINDKLLKYFCFLYANIDLDHSIEVVYKKTWDQKNRSETKPVGKREKVIDITYSLHKQETFRRDDYIVQEKAIRNYLKMERDSSSCVSKKYVYLMNSRDPWFNQPEEKRWYLVKKKNAENSNLFLLCAHLTYEYGKKLFWVWHKELYNTLHQHLSFAYSESVDTAIKLMDIWFNDYAELEMDIKYANEKEKEINPHLPESNWIWWSNKETKSLIIPKILCYKLYTKNNLNQYALNKAHDQLWSIFFWSKSNSNLSLDEALNIFSEDNKKNDILIDYDQLASDFPDARITSLKSDRSLREIINRFKDNRDFEKIIFAITDQLLWRVENEKWVDLESYKDPLIESIYLCLSQQSLKDYIKVLKSDQQEMFDTSWFESKRLEYMYKQGWMYKVITKRNNISSERSLLKYFFHNNIKLLEHIFSLDFQKIQQKKLAIQKVLSHTR